MDFELHSKQSLAFQSAANEILYGGAAGGGKSHLMRVAAIYLCLSISGLQVYLFRRVSDDLVKNHLYGPTGFETMLSDLTAAGMCRISSSPITIKFLNGARIYLCHCQYEKDKAKYQGAEIHVLMIDELTHFTEAIYRYLRGRVRFPKALKIPAELEGRLPLILNGSNPGSIGHNWVKKSFIDPILPYQIWQTPREEGGFKRQFIPALLEDNPSLDKDAYEANLSGLGAKHLVKAMRDGNWNIVAGGMFDDLWTEAVHEVQPFMIPASWKIDRSFDWGSSKPYSVGWWAESDGTDVVLPDKRCVSTVRGDLYRIGELYGCTGTPDEGTKETAVEIADKVKNYEKNVLRRTVYAGPADSSIYSTEDGHSIAQNMASRGVYWTKANKSAGSRINGWELIRQRLRNALPTGLPREKPGLFAFNNCRDFIRTVPVLIRDKNNPDDVDTNTEDHIADETRYRLLQIQHSMKAE